MWILAQSAPSPPPIAWSEVIGNLTGTGTVTMILIFGIPIIAIVMGNLRSIMVSRSKERTRQEVAAYVAEGSMTADEGERLLRAGSPKDG